MRLLSPSQNILRVLELTETLKPREHGDRCARKGHLGAVDPLGDDQAEDDGEQTGGDGFLHPGLQGSA